MAKTELTDFQKTLKKVITNFNHSLLSYQGKAGLEDLADVMIDRAQNIVTFKNFEKGNVVSTEQIAFKEGKHGKYLPNDAKTLEILERRIMQQGQSVLAKRAKDPNFIAGKNYAQEMLDFPSLKESLTEVYKDLVKVQEIESRTPAQTALMSDEEKMREIEPTIVSDAKLKPIPKKATKEQMQEIRRHNQEQAYIELIARRTNIYSGSISEAIQKLYEDETKNADLINELRQHNRWSSATLEAVNLRAMNIVPDVLF